MLHKSKTTSRIMRINKEQTIRILALFFFAAGINHFIMPSFYLPLIPNYLPLPKLLNILAGVAEIVLGVGLFFQKTRRYSGIGIAILMIAFIPSHWHFIQEGSCLSESLCVPAWIAWMRLIIIHPILIAIGVWASRG